MPVAAAIAGAAIVGAGASVYASSKAAKAQKQAAQTAATQQERMFQKQVELQDPFREGGMTAQNQIMQLLGIGGDPNAAGYGSAAQPFGTQQFEQDPGYAFRQAEGMRALERSAAARGNLLSGSTLKGIQRFGQDLASQEYGNAFNRFQIERAARLNPLQSLMGSGQSAANVMTGATGQAGQNIGQMQLGAGQARASGYVGSANALGGALSSVGRAIAGYPTYNAQLNFMKAQTDALNRGDYGGYGGYGGGGYGTGVNPDGSMSYNAYAGIKG